MTFGEIEVRVGPAAPELLEEDEELLLDEELLELPEQPSTQVINGAHVVSFTQSTRPASTAHCELDAVTRHMPHDEEIGILPAHSAPQVDSQG
jgi:hypothetical protein